MSHSQMIDAAGMRVVAISHIDEYSRAFIYGHGIYEGLFMMGDETPAKQPRRPTANEKLDPFRNPRIRLDNGRYIWGMGCWWVAEQDYMENPPHEEVIIDLE